MCAIAADVVRFPGVFARSGATSNAEEQQIRFAARFRNNLTEMRLCLSYIRLIERMRYDASLLASLRLFA